MSVRIHNLVDDHYIPKSCASTLFYNTALLAQFEPGFRIIIDMGNLADRFQHDRR